MQKSCATQTLGLMACAWLVGCAGPTYGPGSTFRGSPPVYQGRAPIYSPVTGPVPAQPVSPTVPGGPIATPPSDLDLSLQPIMQSVSRTPTFRPGPSSPQFATLGQSLDGRSVPWGLQSPQKIELASHAASSSSDGTATTEDLKFRGGRTIPNLTYVNLFIGGPTKWNNGVRQWIDYGLEAGMTDPHLNHVMMQYFNSQPVTTDFRGSFWMSGYQPQRVSQANIKQVVRLLHQQGSFNGMPLDSTVVNFLLPSGVILDDPDLGTSAASALSRTIPADREASSTSGLGGYHGSIRVGQQAIYYSVVVYAERHSNGVTNGIPVFAEPWKNIVATAYHQLQETRTNPDVDDATATGQERYLGWTSDRGQELGDYPLEAATPLTKVFTEVPLADGSDAIPVQLLYSNAVHGPEGPLTQPRSGSALPPAKRRTPRPGGSTPTPSNPSGPDPLLQYIDSEWSKLPAAVKEQVIQLIKGAAGT